MSEEALGSWKGHYPSGESKGRKQRAAFVSLCDLHTRLWPIDPNDNCGAVCSLLTHLWPMNLSAPMDGYSVICSAFWECLSHPPPQGDPRVTDDTSVATLCVTHDKKQMTAETWAPVTWRLYIICDSDFAVPLWVHNLKSVVYGSLN